MPPARPQSAEQLLIDAARVFVQRAYGPGASPIKVKVQLANKEWVHLPILPSLEYIPPEESPPAPQPEEPPLFGHGPDFRCLWWCGRSWPFTGAQAPIVRTLFDAWQNRCPDVSQEYLLESTNSDSTSIADLFASAKGWKVIIVPGGTRGTFRLIDPRTELPPETA